DAGIAERGGHALAVERGHGLVAHDRHARRCQQACAERTGAVDQAGPDGDVVAAPGEIDVDGPLGLRERIHGEVPVGWACRWARSASITCSVVRSAGWAVESTTMSASA